MNNLKTYKAKSAAGMSQRDLEELEQAAVRMAEHYVTKLMPPWKVMYWSERLKEDSAIESEDLLYEHEGIYVNLKGLIFTEGLYIAEAAESIGVDPPSPEDGAIEWLKGLNDQNLIFVKENHQEEFYVGLHTKIDISHLVRAEFERRDLRIIVDRDDLKEWGAYS